MLRVPKVILCGLSEGGEGKEGGEGPSERKRRPRKRKISPIEWDHKSDSGGSRGESPTPSQGKSYIKVCSNGCLVN